VGLEIDREEFEGSDYARFTERLRESLAILGSLFERPGFGEGPASIGAELEVSLVDGDGRPLPFNRAVLAETVDPRLTYELDRFNLESNLRHGPLEGAPFAALRHECVDALEEMQRAAAVHGGRVAMIGILPTLMQRDLDGEAMTESMRYRALSASLRRLRDAPFLLDIRGDDTLQLRCESVAYEGAGTSFQLHLRVSPARFARAYNALQLATPVVLAASGNSPLFLGRRLWAETRVALFKQAVDPRRARGAAGEISRVSFGERWIENALDLFTENVEHHPPLLPVIDDAEDPSEAADHGGLPALRELRLHQGTVWRWNRAIYDPAEGGHLRVELRSFPAGPTVTDMLANVAFQVGVGFAVAQEDPSWTREVDFAEVHGDFYRAAQSGLSAKLAWPPALGGKDERVPAPELVERLLPLAQRGLDLAGIGREDAAPLRACFERRVRSGNTGAAWQLRNLARAEVTRPRGEALPWMLQRYLERSELGEAVCGWEDPPV
jgi:hypothetical protein